MLCREYRQKTEKKQINCNIKTKKNTEHTVAINIGC